MDVTVLAMDGSEPQPHRTVVVQGDRIARVGASGEVRPPDGARVVEGAGAFLMPGLVDAHVHLRRADEAALRAYLAAGITCVREMNGRPFLLEWRRRVASGELVGPCLVVAAPTLGNFSSPRDGYPTPESAADAATAVRRFRDDGYDWIKVYSFLPRASFEGAREAAAESGLPVGGHVPLAVGLEETLRSGVRSIEHLTEYVGSSLTGPARALDEEDLRSTFGAGEIESATLDRLVAETVRAGAWNVPTLVWFDRILPTRQAAEAWASPELRRQGMANRREIVRRLHAAGARLAVGTDSDAGNHLPAEAIHDELVALTEAGIARPEALRMATAGGAELLGILDEVGTVEAGKRADLLLLSCDPTADLACLRAPTKVLARGREVAGVRPDG